MKSKKDLRILLGIVILVAAFARGNALYVCLGIVGVGWLGYVAWSNRKGIAQFFAHKKAKRNEKKAAAKAKESEAAPTAPKPQEEAPKSSVSPERALIRHINHRITDKLRSVYPDAFWNWEEKPTVSFITDGGCRRISVSGAGEYNFAEIKLDKFSNITLDLMKVMPCSEANTDKVVSDFPVDVECWYSNNAQSTLENVIGDLNAKGVTSLTIDENGEVTAIEGEKKTIQAKLDNMPAKASWKPLVEMLVEKFELKATVGKNVIRVSW